MNECWHQSGEQDGRCLGCGHLMSEIEATKAEQALALRGEPVAWIDIDAKLPDAGVQVLCTGFCCDVDELENAIPNEKRWYAVAHRTEFNQWKPEMHGATDGIDDLYKPTHWTPLPSLYAAPISGEPVAWAPRLTTDDKSPYQVVLASLRRYAKTWPPQTDLFRKIRAMDVVRAINEVEALYAAPISGEREAAFFRDAPSPPDAPPRAVSGERVRPDHGGIYPRTAAASTVCACGVMVPQNICNGIESDLVDTEAMLVSGEQK